MNTWNTLPERYHQRVYHNNLGTVECHSQEAENPTLAMVISVEATHVDSDILLEYWTPNVTLEEPEIRNTGPNILTENTCMENEIQFRIAGASRDYEDESVRSLVRNAIPIIIRQRLGPTEFIPRDLGELY
jgi:hypothetical protein